MTTDSQLRRFQKLEVREICCEIRDAMGIAMPDLIAPHGNNEHINTKISIDLSLTPANTRAFLQLLDKGLNIRARVDKEDERIDSANLRPFDEHTAQTRILRGVLECLTPPIAPVVVACIAAGWRRRTVSYIADLLKLSERSVERRMSAAGAPPARTVLAWAIAMHSLWRLEAMEWEPKQVAARAGFQSMEALSNHVKRCTGKTVRRLLNDGGFEALIAQFRLIFPWQPAVVAEGGGVLRIGVRTDGQGRLRESGGLSESAAAQLP